MRVSTASFVLTAMVGAGFAVTHGFGPSTPPQRPEIPRSIVSVGEPGTLGGSANVTVSSGPAVHHYSPGTLPAARPSQRHALLVGINHAIGGRPLQGAVADALNVKQALLEYGFPSSNVVTLLDGQATRAAILKGLDDLVASTPASGLAVVAIAGHSRQHGGVDQLLAADGARVNSTEIASRLQRLRARAWIALPTCFAAGYALPGIVGHNRIATFASSSNSESYEVGSAGSYLIIEMVKRAMLDRQAPDSVESAFAWAKADLERTHPYRVPTMSDGIDGDLVLGDLGPGKVPSNTGRRSRGGSGSNPWRSGGGSSAGGSSGGPADTPAPPPSSNNYRTSVEVCGNYRLNCSAP